jgi:hypothetical protein
VSQIVPEIRIVLIEEYVAMAHVNVMMAGLDTPAKLRIARALPIAMVTETALPVTPRIIADARLLGQAQTVRLELVRIIVTVKN